MDGQRASSLAAHVGGLARGSHTAHRLTVAVEYAAGVTVGEHEHAARDKPRADDAQQRCGVRVRQFTRYRHLQEEHSHELEGIVR